MKESDRRIRRFSWDLQEAKDIAKRPDLFVRSVNDGPGEATNEIRVLRRWNSHAPAVYSVWGGGYFMRWNRKGTIIDPGCSFIRMFQEITPYGLDDVNMVVVTHDHVDHCQDFGTLISLFREYNTWRSREGKLPRMLDAVVSHGVMQQYDSMLMHPENTPFLWWRKVLPPESVTTVQDLPKSLKDFAFSTSNDGEAWEAYLRYHKDLCLRQIGEKDGYGYDMHILPAIHKELLGHHTSMGIRFVMKADDGNCVVVISGDTSLARIWSGGVSHRRETDLVACYSGANLLILHVGSMEERPGKECPNDHLGFTGVTKILESLKKQGSNPPSMVVLTEWGYEFGRLSLNGRTEFTRLVAKHVGKPYYAAVKGTRVGSRTVPIIPADLNLRISLPDLRVWCRDGKTEGYVDMHKVRAAERWEQIDYTVK